MDAGASRVFSVADHQVAHVYLNDRSLETCVRQLLESVPGIDQVLTAAEQVALGLDHPRAGDLVVISKPNAWFTYYYWDDERFAPDFARCVDIHRKPGYDPVELFLDPAIPAVKLKILWRLLQKKLGFRMLMDVIPLDATLVKGSHGRRPKTPDDWPVLITDRPGMLLKKEFSSTDVYSLVRALVRS
jgi:predicted AlkP superfamily pyrophosphatase or phosphodiesterase